ncbi:glycosyltransferase [Providencia hangzhouensis]
MKIEILVSTLNDGIENLSLSPSFDYLIIHQVNNQKDYTEIYNKLKLPNVKCISSNTIGLSISRNIAIKNSTADFIWIMDDDVEVTEDSFIKISNFIEKNPNYDMFVLSHATHIIKNNKIKTFEINKITAMSISSIDMLIKRKSILENNILFNESFGLGAKYPSGEEYILAIDMLKRGLRILKTTQIFALHPDISSGNDFYSTPIKLESKLKMFKHCYGRVLGNAFYLAFIMKKNNYTEKQ